MNENQRTLVAIATYNEIENLPTLVDEVFEHASDADVLIIDDGSPDGTGQWCDEKAESEPRLRVIHRPSKLGLGTATVAGFRYAMDRGYDFILVMDADFSHHPRYLPAIRGGMEQGEGRDVMIGSRYVPGGGVEGWPFTRHVMSRCVNTYARLLLGLSVRDCSGAFRCYRTSVLRRIEFDSMLSRGYSYLEELLWLLKRHGARFGETPIVFVDRQQGQSKINPREAFAALWILFRLGLKNWFGGKP